MLYTLEGGRQGRQLPRRYTVQAGSQIRIVPAMPANGIAFDGAMFETIAKYTVIPVIGVIVLASILQTNTVPHVTPSHASTKPGQATGTAIHIMPAASTTSTAQTTNPSYSGPSVNTGPAAVSESAVQASNASPSTPSSPTTNPVSDTPVTVGPISVDPTIPPVLGNTLSSTSGGVKTPPTTTNSVTDPTGSTVTTPVAQAGVDVFPPSVSLGL